MTSATTVGRVFDPAGPEHRPDPHPLFHRMREQAPVHRHVSPSGRAFWYLTRYADVQRALLHPDLGRELDRLPPELAAVHRRWDRDPLAMVRRNMFNLDPPDHTRLRRLMAPAFGPRTVAALERRVHQVVGELAGGLAAGAETGAETGGEAEVEVDLIEALALPLPIMVVAELVGFPAADLPRLRRWSDAMLRGRDAAQVRRAGLEFVAYVNERIDERRARPDTYTGERQAGPDADGRRAGPGTDDDGRPGGAGEDLLSRLVRAERDGAGISHEELVSSVFQLLLAGDETTVNLIGNGVLELLRHPDQLDRLRARPEMIGSMVEEAMRFNGPVGHSRPLYALADVRFGDAVIPRGDIVLPVLLAANRDPAVFPRPDVFDIGRDPNRHLGFGHGIHFCLGAALARLQARAAIGALVRRFPGMALAADPAGLEWTPDLFLHGVRRLPLLLRQRPPVKGSRR
ncbi:cytochrome P450 family protein [Sphaerisporangium corydalis]|uniref:Cytochrome P450 n=1 Tax=Sphaerisporangium corydalis TaxID=1441875 RepID=A0ABV9E9D9_9ACTN|nr:cytochrome P450 [Sphaerisporangium corydalis]